MVKVKRRKYGLEIICGSVEEARELACELDYALYIQKIGNHFELNLK